MRDCLVRQCGRAGRLVGGCARAGLLDPVVGDALRTVGYGDRSTLAESKGCKRVSHWCVVLVSVAAQVVSVLSREAENRSCDPMPTHCGHTVNHVVVGVGMPRAIDLGVGLVWPGSECKDGERPSLIGHEKAVSVRNVFLSINPARVPFGPLSRIPVRLHERAGMRIGTLDEIKVVRGSDSNLHAVTLSVDYGLLTTMSTT